MTTRCILFCYTITILYDVMKLPQHILNEIIIYVVVYDNNKLSCPNKRVVVHDNKD